MNQVLIQYALHQKRQDSNIINISGRQRMLSQRIALKFHELKYEKISLNEIEGYYKEWVAAHDELLVANHQLLTSFFASSALNKINQHLESLTPNINFIEKEIAILKLTGTIPLEAIISNQEGFLKQMDKLVYDFTDYSNRKLTIIIILELILATLTILVIALEVRYIYYPQAKKLEASLDEVEQKSQILNLTNKLLDKKNKELEQFNYIVSHDLKEPLRTINNYINLIEEDFDNNMNPNLRRFFKVVKGSANRMRLLIESLLNYSRLGINKSPTQCNCNQILAEVVAGLENQIKKTNATLHLENLPETSVYGIEMHQLLQNLISNALKFNKKDHPVVITVGCNEQETAYEFFVSDNGIGIDSKYFDKIFQVFQRLNNRKEYEGEGIGLANCKKIVELHGGKIWVESVINQGSTFKFTIPKSNL